MTTDDTPIETSEAEARPWQPSDGYLPAGGEPTQPAMAAFDAAVAEVGVRNVLLASDLRGAFVRHLAATLQPPAAQQGDLCQNCAPDGRCMKRQALCGVKLAAQQGEASNLWKQGHGHVVPRADGVKARCGGPALCKVCQAEQAALEKAQQGEAVAPSNALKEMHGKAADDMRRAFGGIYPEHFADQPAAAPQPVAQGDDYVVALLAAWDAVRDPGPAGDDVPHPVFAAGFKAGWSANAAAPAGVVGEPAAWMDPENPRDPIGAEKKRDLETINGAPGRLLAARYTVRLYTAAPARQALTDERIGDIVREVAHGSAIRRDGSTSHRIARAIERAHGIGGKGETA